MVDIEAVLHKLESMGLLRLNRINGDYYNIYCPIHKDGQERKPSCGILLRDQYRGGKKYSAGWCHCFGCGYAKSLPDLITDLLKKRGISKDGVEWLKENVPGFDPTVDIELLIPPDLAVQVSSSMDMGLDFLKKMRLNQKSYISEEELASYRFTVPYMYQRKMTDEAIERFDVGFDPHFKLKENGNEIPCITIPVRDLNGKTLFFCRRSIEGKIFHYPRDVLKPVYGLELVPKDCKSLIIVESAINAITCFVYGYTAVALLGTGNDYQIQQLKETGIREFVLCLDNDESGQKGVNRLKKALRKSAMIWTMHMPAGRDVNDVSKEEFDQLYLIKD